MNKYGRKYHSKQEYEKRQAIFERTLAKVSEHNKNDAWKKGFKMAINRFSDMTEEEKQELLGVNEIDI